MSVTYSSKQITGGIPYADDLTLDELPFTISSDAGAVTAVLLDKAPSKEQAELPTVLVSAVNLTYKSGSRNAGESSVWGLAFTDAHTNLLLNENGTIKIFSPVIQVTIRGTATSERIVFTSDPLTVGVSMEAVTTSS